MGLLEGLRDAFKAGMCNLSTTQGLYDAVTLSPINGVSKAEEDRRRANSELFWCDKSPYDAPYSPGRCPILYGVTVTYRITGNPVAQFNGTFTQFGTFWGPIGTASHIVEEADSPGGRQIVRVTLMTHSNELGQYENKWTRFTFSPGEFHEDASLVILNVESVQSDPNADGVCSEFIDTTTYTPEAYTDRRTVNYTTNNNVNVAIPMVFVYGQFKLDANLNLKMPINVKIDPRVQFKTRIPFDIDAELNWNTGEVDINWTGDDDLVVPPSPPSAPSPPGSPSPNNPTPPSPPGIPPNTPDPNDPDSDLVIIAAIVTSTVDALETRASTIFQDDNPDLYVPTLGYISFSSRSDAGAVGWTNDIPVKNLRAYIPCPIVDGAGRVLGTPNEGVEWTITPVYSSVARIGGA